MMNTQDTVKIDLLVLRAQAGDSESLAQLVDLWQPRLWPFARVLTGDDESAWDVMQETWLAVLRDLQRLQDPARFRPWVFRIVRNKAADRVRHSIQERKALARQTSEAPDECVHPREDMRDLLGAMPEQDASLLALHYLEGVTYEEMAAILEVPTGTIKSRLHAARGRLRAILENEHGSR